MASSRRKTPAVKPLDAGPRPLPDFVIWLGLLVAIFAVYWQVGSFDFVTYDDDLYAQNPFVQGGLSLASLKWALTAVVSNNWIPVTLLSHVLDGQFFGDKSGMHHLVNVAFHALATLLLFAALRRATGDRWQSAFVAFLFGLHPLHVGSVAWVAERKDVLSAVFWFLALYAYVLYAEQPTLRRYLWMVLPFCLGLLSKPMLVTFPFALLLFDVWPLRRFEWPKVLIEKLPLIGLSAAASAVTYFVQSSTGAVLDVPFGVRLENALISYVAYLGQMFWPARMAVIYPYQEAIPFWQVGVALSILLVVSGAAWFSWKKRAYLPAGWFWYLGTLVPVIGLVQVGLQSRADRYTYIPMVGLFIILAWGGAEVVERWPQAKMAMIVAAGCVCAACMAVSWVQIGYWQNSETLFQHAIDVTRDNWAAQFREALRIKPDYAEAHNNLGACLTSAGHDAEAIPEFQTALRLKPGLADAHFNLALALSKMPDRTDDAVKEYTAALRLNPNLQQAHANLGVLLVNLGRKEEAIGHLKAAAELHPSFENEHNLGAVLSTMPGREAEGAAHLEAAQRIRGVK
jgi:tetratricopeptide (TPR) repeat protein